MARNETAARKAANLSIDAKVLAEAKALDINVSRAAEAGIAAAVSKEKSRRWLAENREALLYYNAWIDEHGLPLDEYRQF
ncbi:MAG: type II toxin-antitoxin system CcdA family antitoxin [Rhizobiaceae bacterium]